jgi:multidrug efflux pump subunit AcrA (membrane-fusion protein)
LEADAAALNSSLLRLQAEIDAASAAHDEAHEHYLSRLNTLSSLASLSVEELLAPDKTGRAAWHAITALEVRAKEAGIVEQLSVNQGAWLEANTHTVTVLDPTALRFQGKAPQSDLLLLRDGMPCRIVPPQDGGAEAREGINGVMQIGLTAHDEDRTIPLFVKPDAAAPWARAGVTAYLEIPKEESPEELAIPSGSLVQEGLDTIFFRRDPKEADRVLPVKADLGPSDGRWVVVRSGVKEGDEVVLDGAYALKLAGGANKAPEGYHYHADGQLHKNH